jgi:hypothetical protein
VTLSRHPGHRIFGQEPDEVEIQIMVTGARAREVASSMAGNVLYPTEVIPVTIGIPGLDRITGGILMDTSLDLGRDLGEAQVTFTIHATRETPEEPT